MFIFPDHPYFPYDTESLDYDTNQKIFHYVDRSMMYSEGARFLSFHKWPHRTYKYAIPSQMAEVGFYHQPSFPNADRVLCFACSVCLVSWEASDEPLYAIILY